MRFWLRIILGVLVAGQVLAAPDKTPVVFVKKAQLQDVFDSLSYPARIEAKINGYVLAETDGVVTKIFHQLGSSVKRSELLLKIQNTDPVYQYTPMQIPSTVTGVVSQVFVTEGSRVAKGDKLMLVTDPFHVRVSLELAATDLQVIRQGAHATLTFNNKNYEIQVKGVSPFLDPATGTANCELEFMPKQKDLPPSGALAQVLFKANLRKAFSVADSAIVYRGKDTFVRVVRNNRAYLQPVTIGKKSYSEVEILTGLKPDDQVVERTSNFIADGEEVKIEPPGKS